MSTLRFTRLPERGDAVLGDLTTGKPVFLKADSFAALSDIDLTLYEIIGVVAGREGDKVLVEQRPKKKHCWPVVSGKGWPVILLKGCSDPMCNISAGLFLLLSDYPYMKQPIC